MKDSIKDRRGLTKKTLIGLIILIIGFLVVYFFYTRIFAERGRIDKEICHQSVIERATFNVGGLEAGRQLIPLKCKTEKICLYKKEKSCQDLGRKDVRYVKIGKREEGLEKIKREIANSIYDCWSMLGQGKINFGDPKGYFTNNYCTICSSIGFDSGIREEYRKIEGIGEFLEREKIHGKDMTYVQYLTGGRSDSLERLERRVKEEDKMKISSDIDTNQVYDTIFVLSVEGKFRQSPLAYIAMAAGVGIAILGWWTGAPVVLLGSGTALGGVIHIMVETPEHVAAFSFIPHNSNALKELDCERFYAFS